MLPRSSSRLARSASARRLISTSTASSSSTSLSASPLFRISSLHRSSAAALASSATTAPSLRASFSVRVPLGQKRSWENAPTAKDKKDAAAEGEGVAHDDEAAAAAPSFGAAASTEASSTGETSTASSADASTEGESSEQGAAPVVAEEADIVEEAEPSSPSTVASFDPVSSSPAKKASPSSSSTSSTRRSRSSTKATRAAAASASASASPSSSPANASASSPDGGDASTFIPPESNGLHLTRTLILPVMTAVLPPFRKSFTVDHPAVVDAIRQLIKRNEPYIGVFLLKGANTDVITSADQVFPTGALSKIISFSPIAVAVPVDNPSQSSPKTRLSEKWTLTIEPQSRIAIEALLPVPEAPTEEAKQAAKEAAEQMIERAEVDVAGERAKAAQAEEITSFEKIDDGVAAEQAELSSSAAPVTPPPTLELEQLPVSLAEIKHLIPPSIDLFDPANAELKARAALVMQQFKSLTSRSQIHTEQVMQIRANSPSSVNFVDIEHDPYLLLDCMAAVVQSATREELQEVLDSVDLLARLTATGSLLKKDLVTIEMRARIENEVQSQFGARHKKMVLAEQMKAIQKELGQDGGNQKDEVINKFRAAAAELNMPAHTRTAFEAEMSKLAMMEPQMSEYTVTRNYLEWIVAIPWGKHTVDSFSIPSSVKILDEDHFGLQDVKDRILEFLAVGKLRGTVEGKILCFVGPPGVGKTSIAKSIARALERKFYRISVGGLRDVAEIKGHRRTYVGALPGKPIQALKLTQAENPLILIDEIDKIGQGGFQGDPSSALLELLDPEQNSSFNDLYLDLAVDLSKVLFVCTANSLSTIPAPLLDRMEILEISGYVSAEKREIAARYLGPQAKKANGLETADVQIETEAIDELIQSYCRESGVRNLKKKIDQIYRKAAFNIVSDIEASQPQTPPGEAEVLSSTPELASELATVPPPAVSSASSSSSPASSDSSTTLPTGTSTVHTIKPMDLPTNISLRITSTNLKNYVGPPLHQKDRIYQHSPPPGVSNGLGYTGNGAGALMPIEVTVMPGKGAILTTGKLGDVINESIKIAVSYLRTNAFALGITSNETDVILGGSADQDIHLHMPEGAIGKDGPSAGTAILTALVSLLTKTKVDPDIAMTGEITLNGQVLPVGGLKEKILAAHRSRIKKLIVPAAVRGDIEANVPDSVKEGIEIIYVSNVREVLYEVFGTMPVAETWKEKYPLLELYGAGQSQVGSADSLNLRS